MILKYIIISTQYSLVSKVMCEVHKNMKHFSDQEIKKQKYFLLQNEYY